MAILPPSDLILDVARAADPESIQEASNRLRAIAADGSVHGFADAFTSASRNETGASDSLRSKAAHDPGLRKSPAEKFEAMILTQFVEAMLPDNAEAVFGKGASGEIWKSMLAEQVAGQLAASGGVGIADLLSDTLNQGVTA